MFNPRSESWCLTVCFCCHVSIELLPAGETATAVMGIDFCDSTQAANFQLW